MIGQTVILFITFFTGIERKRGKECHNREAINLSSEFFNAFSDKNVQEYGSLYTLRISSELFHLRFF